MTVSRRQRVLVCSWVVLALVAASLTYFAVTAPGYTTRKPELNDGGIWVTSNADGGYARLNKPIAQLDTAVADFEPGDMDVAQSGAAVLVVNRSARQVQSIDPRTGKIAENGKAELGPDGDVAVGGGTAAAWDAGTGRVWAASVDTLSGASPVDALDVSSKPAADVGKLAAVAVTDRGSVVAVSGARRKVVDYGRAEGGLSAGRTSGLAFEPQGPLGLATVGATPMVIDPAAGRLDVDGQDVEVPRGAVLQQSGPATSVGLVATSDALLEVDLAGGGVRPLVEGARGVPAEPVQVGGCAFAAWGGSPGLLVTACGGERPQRWELGDTSEDVVFRVNRSQVTLNDRDTGRSWVLDRDKPLPVDNWDDFNLNKIQKPDDQEEQDRVGTAKPPQTKPDELGVRPGRVSVLNVLDNDAAPEGSVLALNSITGAPRGVTLSRSPDLQTVLADVPTSQTGPFRFQYTVSGGKGRPSKATDVTVTPRRISGAGTAPTRPTGFKGDPRLVVPSGGSLTFPVLPSWRDYPEGDTLSLDQVSVDGGGATASTTPDGLVRLRAGAVSARTDVRVKYVVTDSAGARTDPQQYAVTVLSPQTTEPVPPRAEPDVASGKVGQPVVVRPMLNDLPGADPLTTDPSLRLAGPATLTSGGKVQGLATDVVKGEVSFTPQIGGTFTLGYQVKYGESASAKGVIRVEVAPADAGSGPVAGPDAVVVHDRNPTDVDVLANDFDPGGGVLSVQNATVDGGADLQVAIVRSRWLRVVPNTAELPGSQAVVRYVVSDGSQSARGQVVVSQRPASKVAVGPVAQDDSATVRAGDAVAVPVLDNDYAPDGGAMSINVPQIEDRPAGELEVTGPPGVDDVGTAYVSGTLVRYLPPRKVEDDLTVRIAYQPTTDQGTGDGEVTVTVLPAPAKDRPNHPPTPSAVEARVVTGDTGTLKLSSSGQDVDGDSVTVVGVASAPRLGRVMGFGATSVQYQAFPRPTGGTDTFQVVVADAYGATGLATMRIGVATPGDPQPPVAVDDALKVRPGADVTVDPLANDLLASGQRARIMPLVEPPAGVRLATRTGPMRLRAESAPEAPPSKQPYVLSNGMDEASATVSVRTAPGYNNPPVVYDAFGEPDGNGRRVRVDVLETAYDPDGSAKSLEVVAVNDPSGRASLSGHVVTTTMTDQPQVIPFVVEDAEGGASSANLYVPGRGSGAPYVKPGAMIEVAAGGTEPVDIEDYVQDPDGQPVRITVKSSISTSPREGLGFDTTDGLVLQGRTLPGGRAYSGPAALTVEVTDAAADADDEGNVTTLTIPVQVGDPVPVLTCPTGALRVRQGEEKAVDVASLCHVWTSRPDDADGLTFTASLAQPRRGLEVVDDGTAAPQVRASGSAAEGPATLVVQTTGARSAPARIALEVVEAPPPTLQPMVFDTLRAGQPFTVDLAAYLRAGIDDPEPTLLSLGRVARLDVQRSGTRLRITPKDGSYQGTLRLPVVMSDAGPDAGPERQVEGELVLDVAGKPSAPGLPVSTGKPLSHQVRLTWRAATPNGAAVTRYVVYANGSEVKTCPGTGCLVTGLDNGRPISFRVAAVNAVGEGPQGPAAQYTPDEVPGAVTGLRATDPQDRSISLSWNRAATDGSAVSTYVVSLSGRERRVGTATSTRLALPDNNARYTVRVFAINKKGPGPAGQLGGLQGSGRPATPPDFSARGDQNLSSDATVVTLSWGASDPQGPAPIAYTVTGGGRTLCTTRAQQCRDTVPYDGAEKTYSVTAANATGGSQHTSAPASTRFRAVGKPAAWGGWEAEATGQDNTARVRFTVPSSRGASSSVRLVSDGTAVRTWTGQAGRSIEANVGVGSNGNAHSLVLEQCNEAGNCTSSDGRTVTPYGPIGNVAVSASGGQTAVSWTASVDPNGRPVNVRVTTDKGFDRSYQTGSGPWSQPDSQEVGYGQNVTVTVTVSDTGSPQRAGKSASSSAATAPPPPPPPPTPPTVTVSRGAPATAGTCQNTSGCWRIHIRTQNFSGPVTCSFDSSIGAGGFVTTRMNANDEKDSANVAGRNVTVWATCGGVRSNNFTM